MPWVSPLRQHIGYHFYVEESRDMHSEKTGYRHYSVNVKLKKNHRVETIIHCLTKGYCAGQLLGRVTASFHLYTFTQNKNTSYKMLVSEVWIDSG